MTTASRVSKASIRSCERNLAPCTVPGPEQRRGHGRGSQFRHTPDPGLMTKAPRGLASRTPILRYEPRPPYVCRSARLVPDCLPKLVVLCARSDAWTGGLRRRRTTLVQQLKQSGASDAWTNCNRLFSRWPRWHAACWVQRDDAWSSPRYGSIAASDGRIFPE